MTPIKSFRPKWADRCLYRRRPFFRKLAWAVAIILAAIILWFSVKQHQMYAEAAQRISAAENDRDGLLLVLNGQAQMVEHVGQYLVIERATWQLEDKKK